ncbi:MAG: hypothetical protein Q7U12_14080 [Undibacterium sp.]|nr:hypothetical protein [Undibacterium sp.]MDO8701342.1 hypothetical protein [Undibacterium sp.]MDO9194021.1 hypothetical protein [Undibacterium sp.]
MGAFAMPVYMVDFTPKTITALTSPAAIEGTEVDLDVYDRKDANLKLEAKGQRLKENQDMFRIVVQSDGINNQHDWDFTILRESADRSRKKR